MAELGLVVFLLIGPALGFGAGYFLAQQRAARDQDRLRSLVPGAEVMRWFAEMAEQYAWTWQSDNSALALERVRWLRALAARIEEEGSGE